MTQHGPQSSVSFSDIIHVYLFMCFVGEQLLLYVEVCTLGRKEIFSKLLSDKGYYYALKINGM